VTWQYAVTSGTVYRDGAKIGKGYSGHPPHRNKVADEALHDLGPLPRGYWTVTGLPYDSPLLGPFVLALVAKEGTETFGRDGFRIHGDSKSQPGMASHGCICVDRSVRETIWNSSDRDLVVIE
jgi:hypothetical protein